MASLAAATPQEVGRRLYQIREGAGIKQAELARRIVWSPAVLSRVESGERQLSSDELREVTNAIGTPDALKLSEILDRDWTEIPRPPLDHPDQDLLWEVEQTCREIEELRNQPDVRRAFERRLSEYTEELQSTAKLLLNREHDLAFIGPLGIGKSTAICRMTSLEVPSGDGGPASPVLEAGAGGITICEVHVRTGPSYGLIVEPCGEDEIRAHVMDFTEHILREGSGALSATQDGNDEVTDGISKEIERAIRNMAGLRIRREKGPDGKPLRRDEARDLANRIGTVREYAVEVLARMELHRRDRRDTWYDAGLGKPPLLWLKETFEQINNGRHPDFTLPTRIEVVVPQPLLSSKDWSARLVDTKGIDRTAARPDLEKHLNEPHTLALLCSGFNDAPGTTARLLLERAKEARYRTLELNTAILVLARPNEALAVKDESGAVVDTVEEGYDLKAEQVMMALEPFRLPRVTIEFFNSFGDDPERLRIRIVEGIERIRQNFRSRLSSACANARSLIVNHAQEQVQEVQRAAAHMLATWVAQHRQLPPLPGRVQDSLMEQLTVAYASTIRASVRREGEWRNLSYGHHLGYGARRVAAMALEPAVAGLKEITDTMDASGDYVEAKGLIQQVRDVLDVAFEDLLQKVQIMGKTLFTDALKADPIFWWECQNEWGRGPGYKDRVSNRNADWFGATDRRQMEQQLRDLISREWDTALNRVSSLLETDWSAAA